MLDPYSAGRSGGASRASHRTIEPNCRRSPTPRSSSPSRSSPSSSHHSRPPCADVRRSTALSRQGALRVIASSSAVFFLVLVWTLVLPLLSLLCICSLHHLLQGWLTLKRSIKPRLLLRGAIPGTADPHSHPAHPLLHFQGGPHPRPSQNHRVVDQSALDSMAGPKMGEGGHPMGDRRGDRGAMLDHVRRTSRGGAGRRY